MIASDAELISVLRRYNPWWSGRQIQDLPSWKRACFQDVVSWIMNPPSHRALLLSGARQVGKTTLLLQSIRKLLEEGIHPSNIIYATFDHPLLQLIGPEGVQRLWREYERPEQEVQFIFFDEIQSAKDWQIWLKHHVDFEKQHRITVTGSAMPLGVQGQESGVGRWHTMHISTLSFYEFLELRRIGAPDIPKLDSLSLLFDWDEKQFLRVGQHARMLIGHFHDYILRGGYPECAKVESVTLAQQLLREDIVDKILRRDMTALFGVRRIIELERTFLYLCLHDGAQLDVVELCKSLQLKRPTVTNFIQLLEAAHLITILKPHGYGKEVLRGRPKIYLADAAIASSVLLRGKSVLEDATYLGSAVETACFKHLYHRYGGQSIGFSYWRGKKDVEVDIIIDVERTLLPFEVKYRGNIVPSYYRGLMQFCFEKSIDQAYLITKDFSDFSLTRRDQMNIRLLQIPAPLACYWLGQSELMHV